MNPPDNSEATPPRAPQSSSPLMLLLICCGILLYSGAQTVWQYSKSWPIHQWESGLVAECQRAAMGMPVFESAESGHATHMYGPATTYLIAAWFKVDGPSFWPARLLSLLGLIGILCLLAWIFARRTQLNILIFSFAVIASFGPCVLNFVEPRPDCISLFFAAAAIAVMQVAWSRESLPLMAAAAVLTVVGMLFKQPAAMAAGVPFLAALLDVHRPLTRRRMLMLCCPVSGVAGTLAVIAIWFPGTFHYLLRVPAAYKISGFDMLIWSAKLSILLSFLAAVWLTVQPGIRPKSLGHFRRQLTPAQIWTLAALLVAVPCCLLTASKTGGNANCLLPAVVAGVSVLLAFGNSVQQHLMLDRPLARWLPLNCSGCLSLCVVAAFALSLTTNVRADVSYGDAGFASLVRLLRDTDGTVACPQDPAAGVLAGRRPGRSLMLEYDAAGWPEKIPGWFFDELQEAMFVVSVGQGEDWRFWPLGGAAMESFLRDRGFEPLNCSALKNSVYRVWQRKASSRLAQSQPRQ